MNCSRCGKELQDYEAYVNAITYGTNYYACPYCGKLHVYSCEVVIKACSDEEAKKETFDDWGNEIVLDKDFQSNN